MVPSLLKIEDKPIAVCLKRKDAHPDKQCIRLVHLKNRQSKKNCAKSDL